MKFLCQVSEAHVRRYIDGSFSPRSNEWNTRRSTWQSGRESDGDLADDSVATVGLEFTIDLPMQTTGTFALRRVSCTAFVGDIYRSVTHANLSIVDGRSPKAIATIRTPSHLLHSASKLSTNFLISCWT